MAKLNCEALAIEIYGTVNPGLGLASVTMCVRTSTGFAGSVRAKTLRTV